MTKTVSSSRTNLEQFAANYKIPEFDKTTRIYYYALANAKIDENKFLIISTSKKQDQNIANLVKYIMLFKGKKVKIYIDKRMESKFRHKTSNMIFYTLYSDEFMECLATAKYIYSNSYMFYNFINRDGQFLAIDSSVLQRGSINNRLQNTRSINKADYILADSLGMKEYFDIINQKPNNKPSDKTKLLFALCLNNDNYENTFALAYEYASKLDYDKYELTLMLNGAAFNDYSGFIDMFDERVNILTLSGRMFMDDETITRLKFIDNEIYYIDEQDMLTSFLSDDVFEYELGRFFGNMHYDYGVNFSFDSYYWARLLQGCCDKIAYVNCNFEYKKDFHPDNFYINRAVFQSRYENVYYLNAHTIESRNNMCNNIDTDKQKLIDTAFEPYKDDAKLIKLYGEDNLVVSEFVKGKYNTYNVHLMPIPKKGAKYVLIPNSINTDEAEKMVLATGSSNVYIFDMFNVLKDSKLKNDEDYYYTNSIFEYKTALKYFS